MGRCAAPSSAPELPLSVASVASRHGAGTEENFGGVYGTNEGAALERDPPRGSLLGTQSLGKAVTAGDSASFVSRS